MAKKIVTLPLFVKARAESHAMIALKKKGLKKDSPKGKELFEKTVHAYCTDYYHHGLGQKEQNPKNNDQSELSKIEMSYLKDHLKTLVKLNEQGSIDIHDLLKAFQEIKTVVKRQASNKQKKEMTDFFKNIPAVAEQLKRKSFNKKRRHVHERRKNPYTPRISAKSYALMPVVSGPDAPLLKNIKDPKERQIVERKTRAPITSLVQLYAEHTLGLNPRSAFNFESGMSEDEKKKVVINRYKRLFGATLVSEAIRRFLSMSPEALEKILDEMGINEKTSLHDLQDPARRSEFVKKILNR